MAICVKCGKEVADSVKFCTSCGAAMEGKSVKSAILETQAEELQADPADAEQHKGMAVLAYILFFIPLLTGDYNKSPFVKYHTNQGLVLFLFSMGGSIISSILMVIIIGFVLIFVVGIASLVFFIIGIMNVMNGRMKPLPLIGKFTILQ